MEAFGPRPTTTTIREDGTMKAIVLFPLLMILGCASTPEQAARQNAAIQQFLDNRRADRAIRMQAVQPSTHTYMLNGRMVTCTTMGTMTTCN